MLRIVVVIEILRWLTFPPPTSEVSPTRWPRDLSNALTFLEAPVRTSVPNRRMISGKSWLKAIERGESIPRRAARLSLELLEERVVLDSAPTNVDAFAVSYQEIGVTF